MNQAKPIIKRLRLPILPFKSLYSQFVGSPFLRGMGSIFNLAGGFHGSDFVDKNDAELMREDWELVGNDIAVAANGIHSTYK
mgnify:CR=1 FL=1